jgi:hypothetical protein
MKVLIQLTKTEESKALPILYRHSPGTALPGGKYVLEAAAAEALRKAGIHFVELSRDVDAPSLEGVARGERI